MIVIKLNGEARTLAEPLTLQELLREFQIPPQAIAIAVNSEVIPRSAFEKMRVRNNDWIEIIHAVGGG